MRQLVHCLVILMIPGRENRRAVSSPQAICREEEERTASGGDTKRDRAELGPKSFLLVATSVCDRFPLSLCAMRVCVRVGSSKAILCH